MRYSASEKFEIIELVVSTPRIASLPKWRRWSGFERFELAPVRHPATRLQRPKDRGR